ncbi:cytochrome P450 [Microbacterium lacus]|uniref:cytochrome P450 n=1 Tax=Microbacterium lacus TaxID=415217 RepID=UPI00384F143A
MTSTTMTEDRPGAVTSQLDPYSDAFLSEPFSHEQTLRDAGPLIWLPQYGAYAMARYDQVHHALNDTDTFSSGKGVGIETRPEGEPPNILMSDDPLHSALRRVHNKVLNPAYIRGLRATFRESAEGLIDPLVGAGPVDGIGDLAVAFPLSVFPDMVGVRKDGRENLLKAASLTFNSFGPQNRLRQAAQQEGPQAMGWLWEQTAPGATADGVGQHIHEVAADQGLHEMIARGLVAGLLIPGLDTTMHGLGLALYYLATNPDQWQLLKADPSRARAAFEEAVRLGSPVQTFARVATRDVEVAPGSTIPEGERVLLFLGSANRDPRRWDAPEAYDISRVTSGHVGFGSGGHSCSGQNIARMEAECILGVLAERASSISLAGEPVYELNNSLRGFRSLPIRIDA